MFIIPTRKADSMLTWKVYAVCMAERRPALSGGRCCREMISTEEKPEPAAEAALKEIKI